MYSSPTFNTLRDSYDNDNYKFGAANGSGFKEMLGASPDREQVFTMASGAEEGESADADHEKLDIRRELTFH